MSHPIIRATRRRHSHMFCLCRCALRNDDVATPPAGHPTWCICTHCRLCARRHAGAYRDSMANGGAAVSTTARQRWHRVVVHLRARRLLVTLQNRCTAKILPIQRVCSRDLKATALVALFTIVALPNHSIRACISTAYEMCLRGNTTNYIHFKSIYSGVQHFSQRDVHGRILYHFGASRSQPPLRSSL